MKPRLDLKAISYGVVTFIVTYLCLGGVGVFASHSSGNAQAASWALIQILGIAIPVGAGFVSAYFARDRRVLHGIIGGSIGVLPFAGIAAAFIPFYPAVSILVVLVIYAVVAALGAIIGNHMRARLGP